jgi:fatty acid desaturase
MSMTLFTTEEQHAIEEKGFVFRMVCLPAAVAGLAYLAWHWPVDNGPLRVLGTLFTAYCLFCWTSCFHETAHQTLTRWRWFDIALGRVIGTLIYVPYTVYRESHIRHHSRLNRPDDWELWPYSNPKCSRTFRRAFVVLDLVLGFLVAPFVYSRIFFHRDSPLKNPAIRRTIALEYLGIALFWGFVLSRRTYMHNWTSYIEVWLIPQMIAGVFQTTRKLTEHLGMASYDPMLGTRTVVGNNWFTRILSFVNFDIFVHGPHHRHPRVAHDQLTEKMNEYIANNPETNYPVYPSYLRATLAMLPFLVKNPGIGMNVGAPHPDQAKVGDLTNFPADVMKHAA